MLTRSQVDEYYQGFKKSDEEEDRLPKVSAANVPEETNYFADIFQGVISGAEGAFRGVYNLVDGITLDSLPDWRDPYFEKPKTLVGGLVGGVAQFAVGWGLTGGAIKLFSATSKLAGLTLSNPINAAVAKKVGALAAAGKSTQATVLQSMYRGATRGAFVDFVAYSEDEERLANLIQDSRFANPVTELLAMDEDDNIFESRLKNVLEGFTLGSALDLTFAGVGNAIRRSRKVRKAVEAGVEPEKAITDAMKEFPQEPPPPPEIRIEVQGDKAVPVVGKPMIPGTPEYEAFQNKFAADSAAQEKLRTADARRKADEAAARGAKKAVEGGAEFEKLSPRGKAIAKAIAASADRGTLEFDLQTIYDSFAGPPGPGGLNVAGRKLTPSELDELGIPKDFPNFEVFGEDDSAARIYRAALELGWTSANKSNQTMKQLRSKALSDAIDIQGLSPRAARSLIEKMSVEQLHAMGHANRVADVLVNHRSAQARKYLQENGKGLLDGTADTTILREYVTRVKEIAELRQAVGQFRSGMGFEFRALQEPVGVFPKEVADKYAWKDLEELETLMSTGVTPENAAAMKRLVERVDKTLGTGTDGLVALEKWNKLSPVGKFFNGAREYYINSILSNPGSWVANLGSGIFNGVFLPFEAGIGAKLAKTLGGVNDVAAKTLIAREQRTAIEFMRGMSEFLEINKKYGLTPNFSKNGKIEEQFSALRHVTQGRGAILEKLGKFVTIPSSALGKTDDALKVLSYRARAAALLHEEAVKQGLPVAEMKAYVENGIELMTNRRGDLRAQIALDRHLKDSVVSGAEDIPADVARRIDLQSEEIEKLLAVHDQSVKFAEDVTWTQGLSKERGFIAGTGAVVQQWVQQWPNMAFLLPFVRTPANIAQFAWDRSFGLAFQTAGLLASKSKFLSGGNLEGPLFALARELQDPNPAVRAAVMGRVATAVTVTSSLIGMSSVLMSDDGLPIITGKGPGDKEERRALEQAGWQPYSIKVGGRYLSYSRFDPIASALGMVADYTEALNATAGDPTKEDHGLENLGVAIVAAFANNFTNKTYLQGLTNMLDAASGDERKVSSAIGGLVGGFVPSVLANQTGGVDPYVREIRSVTDRVRARIPGLSDTLAARRNILGEKVSRESTTGLYGLDAFLPTRATQIKDDVIAREVADLKFGFNIPGLSYRGIDLTDEQFSQGGQDAYDRYMQLSGEVKLRGKTLRQALRKVINSAAYQALPAGFDEFGGHSPRVGVINQVLSQYRRKAWDQLLKERPTMREAVSAVRKAARARRPTLLD